jgi:hypothetical protein
MPLVQFRPHNIQRWIRGGACFWVKGVQRLTGATNDKWQIVVLSCSDLPLIKRKWAFGMAFHGLSMTYYDFTMTLL